MTAINVTSRPRSRVFKNLLVSYAAQIITTLLSIAPVAFVPVYLGAVGMGKLAVAASFTSIFGTLIVMGTAPYIVREIARNHERLAEIVSGSVLLRLGIGVLLIAPAAMLLYLLDYPDDTRRLALIMYISVIFRMLSATFASALQAIENMAWRAAVGVAREAIYVGAGLLALSQGGGMLGLVLVVLLADVSEMLANASYFVFKHPIRPVLRRTVVLELFRGGLPFLVWVFLQTVYTQASSLMLSKLGGEEATGWYATGLQFVIPLFGIPVVAITVLSPRLARIFAHDPENFRRAVSRALSYMILITMPVAFGMYAIAAEVIDLFNYPPTFQSSIPVLQVLAFTLPTVSLLMLTATSASSMKRERVWSRVSFFSLITVVGLNAILVPLAGRSLGNPAIGAAVAKLGAEGATLLLALHIFGSHLVDRGVFLTFVKTTVAGLAMAAVVMACNWLPLPLMIALGGVVYVGGVVLLRILPADEQRTAINLVIQYASEAINKIRRALTRNR